MKAISILKKYITSSDYRFFVHYKLNLHKNTTDEVFLTRRFHEITGKVLDLDDPRSFNEKLQWLKLNDRNPRYTQLVDKYAVREIIAREIGEEYLIPLVGGPWDSFEEIDFNLLPDQFVLKCTHDSGGVVICKDKKKLDINAARKKLTKALGRDYYQISKEWPYKNVPHKIIAEAYMVDESGTELKDYKLMCFSGRVKCSFICSDRFTEKGLHVTFFDREWNVMPFERCYPSYKEGLPKPKSYEEMMVLAEKLSEGIPFVRVDFYDINGKIYFGEITFYPGSGYETFSPEEWDYTLGSWIELPLENKISEG